MQIAARQSFMTGAALSPYDAEIEYLGSDSVNAYINPNVLVSGANDFELKMSFAPSASVRYGGGKNILYKVGRQTRTAWNGVELAVTSATTTQVTCYAGTDIVSATAVERTITFTAQDTWDINAPHTLLIQQVDPLDTTQTCLYVDGVKVGSCQRSSNALGVPWALCQDFNTVSTSTKNTVATPCRIYCAKIWDNGALIGDFKPVRVGTVGYMFDDVTKQLFGTAGTGAFTLGPDL